MKSTLGETGKWEIETTKYASIYKKFLDGRVYKLFDGMLFVDLFWFSCWLFGNIDSLLALSLERTGKNDSTLAKVMGILKPWNKM